MGKISSLKITDRSRLTLVLLSDTHQLHRYLDIPEADILVHAGDFTLFSLFSRGRRAMADFDDWLGKLPHRHKIIIPGNHEYALEMSASPETALRNARVLINEDIDIDGLRIWGSPVTPLGTGAFGVPSGIERRGLYQQIPKGTDVLITHGRPYGILDCAPGSNRHEGCQELLEATMRVQPKLHVFGHIHAGYGTFRNESTTFANVALMGAYGALDNRPMLFGFNAI